MNLGLKGKAAVITGASRGLGAAIADALAAERMDVALVARDRKMLDERAAALRSRYGVRAVTLDADISSTAAVDGVAHEATATFERIDLLVNCAGATKRGNFFKLTDTDWESGFALKFFGAVRLSRALWPALVKSHGSIVNIVGVGARMPAADFTIGGSVNAAFLNFTKALAEIGIRDGVRVNAINPGFFHTDRLAHSLRSTAQQSGVPIENAQQTLLANIGVHRFGRPEEVGHLVAYLASDQASYMNGAAIEIDGGTRRNI
jgi:3-oxoacyl-[acyl-carrier protein] reductase